MKKEEGKERLLSISTLILFGTFLLIGIVFYVSLSIVKSGQDIGVTNGAVALSPGSENFKFGLEETIFALVFGLFITGFLLWIKSAIKKNIYLGATMGIIGSIMIGYAFYLKYKGSYSTGFMVVTSLVILVYIGMNFFRYRKED